MTPEGAEGDTKKAMLRYRGQGRGGATLQVLRHTDDEDRMQCTGQCRAPPIFFSANRTISS